jgi:hypothetical protein
VPSGSLPQSLSRKQYSPRDRSAWQVRPLQASPVAHSLFVVHAQPTGRMVEVAVQERHLPSIAPGGTSQTTNRVSSSCPAHCAFNEHAQPGLPPPSPGKHTAWVRASVGIVASVGGRPQATANSPAPTIAAAQACLCAQVRKLRCQVLMSIACSLSMTQVYGSSLLKTGEKRHFSSPSTL